MKSASLAQPGTDEAFVNCQQEENWTGHDDGSVGRTHARTAAHKTAVAGGGHLGYNTPPPSHKVRTEMAKSKQKPKAGSKSTKTVARSATATRSKAKSAPKAAKPKAKAKPSAAKPVAAKVR